MTMQMETARREAAARMAQRRLPDTADRNRSRDAKGNRVEEGPGSHAPAATLADWLDEMTCALGQYRGEFSTVTVTVLEQARLHGTDAACAALKAGRRLDFEQQYHLNLDVGWLRNHAGNVPGARALVSALDRECSRLGLDRPRPKLPADRQEVDWDEPSDESRSIRYPTPFGIPAGVLR